MPRMCENTYLPTIILKLKAKKRELQEKKKIIDKKVESVDRSIKQETKKYIICNNCNCWSLKSGIKKNNGIVKCPVCGQKWEPNN